MKTFNTNFVKNNNSESYLIKTLSDIVHSNYLGEKIAKTLPRDIVISLDQSKFVQKKNECQEWHSFSQWHDVPLASPEVILWGWILNPPDAIYLSYALASAYEIEGVSKFDIPSAEAMASALEKIKDVISPALGWRIV